MRLVIWAIIWLMSYGQLFGQLTSSPNFDAIRETRLDPNELDTFVVSLNKIPELRDDIKILYSDESHLAYTIVTSWQSALELSGSSQTKFIDMYRAPKEESVLDDPNFAFNRIRKAQSLYPELAGNGLVVCIKERRFDIDDIDLLGKSIELKLGADSESQHATDMATIISGMGNTSPFNLGVVPAATISTSDFNNLLPDDPTLLQSNGVFTQNHSYGVGIENYYGVEAAAYDQLANDYPTLIHVFSVGNAGTQTPLTGTYAGLPFANLSGTFKQAKNIITVSAVDTTLTASALNSRGPAYDGRIKPELTAYGGRGTSDAAALVSGITTMLQDAYRQKESVFPESSLIKSILIASAEDIGTPGPDYITGYGKVNTVKALEVIQNDWFRSVDLIHGDTLQIPIDIPANINQLRINIAWTDPAANEGADSALVNNINSRLLRNDGEWLPWVLNREASEEALSAPAVKGIDHLNTVELISADTLAEDAYTLELIADLYADSQRVHVAWHYDYLNEFTWDYPSSRDLLIAGTQNQIYWTETFGKKTAELAYEFDGVWTTISNNLNLDRGYYKWNTPDSVGQFRLSATIDDEIYTSDPFLVSPRPDVIVAYNCDSTFGLQWHQIAGAKEYQVYEMQADSLRIIGTTADTSYIIDKNSYNFYAVAPVFDEGIGLRNQAFNYQFQGSFCYFNFFSAQKTRDQIKITLELSSSLNVSSIVFVKESEEEQEILQELIPASQTSFTLIDTVLTPGSIDYYAVLNLADGSSLQSNISTVLIDSPDNITFFPNPTNDAYINTLSNGEHYILEVTDRSGKPILQQELFNRINSIYVEHLDAGVYFYRVFQDGNQVHSGRFIKL